MSPREAGLSKVTTGPRCRLLCGVSTLADQIEIALTAFGWEQHQEAELTLMVDGPWGFALRSLQNSALGRTVVVTDNPCPEYWEDLWDIGPCALLVGGHNIPDIVKALTRVHAGEVFRQLPHHDSPLTIGERQLLRAAAIGLENKQVACEQQLSIGTVKNGLNRVFEKLGLKNRTQAALYYWGLWQWLEPHPSRKSERAE